MRVKLIVLVLLVAFGLLGCSFGMIGSNDGEANAFLIDSPGDNEEEVEPHDDITDVSSDYSETLDSDTLFTPNHFFSTDLNPAEVVAASPRRSPSEANWNLHLVNLFHPLPDAFFPPLIPIEGRFTYNQNIEYYFDSRAVWQLTDMLSVAASEGVRIYVTSAFRTLALQSDLFLNQVNSFLNQGYNEADAIRNAARWVAFPGTSEHQLGLAVDFVTPDHYWLAESFENTTAFAWLQARAHDFGFILRYPRDKMEITGIDYEPWHYRFVGVPHAAEMRRLGVTLEEYLLYLERR
jgi:D-alanyl-D-alanine carboxypeptidase